MKSSFGCLKISRGYNVEISECDIRGDNRPEVTFLAVTGCDVNVKKSTFYKNTAETGPSFLEAVESQLRIENVNITENKAPEGIIQIWNGSSLYMNNVTFSNNGLQNQSFQSTLGVIQDSFAKVENCNFSGNYAARGSCFSVYPNSSIIIEKSVFIGNKADKGGVIYF